MICSFAKCYPVIETQPNWWFNPQSDNKKHMSQINYIKMKMSKLIFKKYKLNKKLSEKICKYTDEEKTKCISFFPL